MTKGSRVLEKKVNGAQVSNTVFSHLKGSVTSVRWRLVFLLKEPICCYVHVDTPLSFVMCLGIVYAHFYCKIFTFEGVCQKHRHRKRRPQTADLENADLENADLENVVCVLTEKLCFDYTINGRKKSLKSPTLSSGLVQIN